MVSITLVLKLGSLSNDNGDGNENDKRAVGLDWKKKTTLHVHHSFCTFLCRHCTTTTWNFLISRLWRTGTHDNDFLFLSLNLGTVL